MSAQAFAVTAAGVVLLAVSGCGDGAADNGDALSVGGGWQYTFIDSRPAGVPIAWGDLVLHTNDGRTARVERVELVDADPGVKLERALAAPGQSPFGGGTLAESSRSERHRWKPLPLTLRPGREVPLVLILRGPRHKFAWAAVGARIHYRSNGRRSSQVMIRGFINCRRECPESVTAPVARRLNALKDR
jgi:hypothetical protein